MNRSLSIMSNTVSLREAYFQLPVFFSGNFKVTVIDWHHAGEIMWQSGRWSGGGGLRYMEINRNIKESHKKKTWTFRLIVFWGGALWMAIYSLPFPPSLWRKLFCKLIIQICQNARIRTIYIAEILFVVSASQNLSVLEYEPRWNTGNKGPPPLFSLTMKNWS